MCIFLQREKFLKNLAKVRLRTHYLLFCIHFKFVLYNLLKKVILWKIYSVCSWATIAAQYWLACSHLTRKTGGVVLCYMHLCCIMTAQQWRCTTCSLNADKARRTVWGKKQLAIFGHEVVQILFVFDVQISARYGKAILTFRAFQGHLLLFTSDIININKMFELRYDGNSYAFIGI